MYSPPSEEAADWKRTKRDMNERLPSWPTVQREETEVWSAGRVSSGITTSCFEVGVSLVCFLEVWVCTFHQPARMFVCSWVDFWPLWHTYTHTHPHTLSTHPFSPLLGAHSSSKQPQRQGLIKAVYLRGHQWLQWPSFYLLMQGVSDRFPEQSHKVAMAAKCWILHNYLHDCFENQHPHSHFCSFPLVWKFI